MEGFCEGCGRESVDLSFHTLIECQLHYEERNKFITACVDETSIISALLNMLDFENVEKKLVCIY